MELLRFITCGSVDDGKSTLIGRLLYESKLLYADHLAALEADSKRVGTRGGELDFALLVDGLAAEREQGITIDVAYRFFATEARRFIVADTPGHEQYTRNMVTGASTADAAVILLDARKGVLSQTRRHAHIVSLLGIRHVALAVNKLDLVGYSQEVFDEVSAEFAEFAAELDFDEITCVPMSAIDGVNVVGRSELTPVVRRADPAAVAGDGRTSTRRRGRPVPVPRAVGQPAGRDFRGLLRAGAAAARCGEGDTVARLPGDRTSTVDRIVTMDGDLAEAPTGSSVTVVLADDVDVSRGDVLAGAHDPPGVGGRRSRRTWSGSTKPTCCPDGSTWPRSARARSGSPPTAEVPHRDRLTAARTGDQGVAAQRDRRRQRALRRARAVRELPGEPRPRLVRRARPADQRHGRRRDDRLRAAPRRPTCAGRR